MEFQTQIIFDGPFMRLRYKQRDRDQERFHYVIHTSWKPPMETAPLEPSALKTPTGTKATPIPSTSVLDKANTAIFMNIKGLNTKHTEDTLKNALKEYLEPEHKELVLEVKNTKKPDLIVVYCQDWAACNDISKKYTKKFMNHEVSFSLFTKSNPGVIE